MTERIRYDTITSPLGALLLTAQGPALCGVYMQGERHAPAIGRDWLRDRASLRDAIAQLEQYFAGERSRFDLALAPAGTQFQRRVWSALREIPYAATISYRELARRIGAADAVRAVGAANGKNPLSLVVPCHRVIGSDGSLTGYAGGLARKRWLLDHEASIKKGRTVAPSGLVAQSARANQSGPLPPVPPMT